MRAQAVKCLVGLQKKCEGFQLKLLNGTTIHCWAKVKEIP